MGRGTPSAGRLTLGPPAQVSRPLVNDVYEKRSDPDRTVRVLGVLDRGAVIVANEETERTATIRLDRFAKDYRLIGSLIGIRDDAIRAWNDGRAVLTAESIVLRGGPARAEVLLVRRTETPFVRRWMLPGTELRRDETTLEAAQRGLLEMTGVTLALEDLREMDPRGTMQLRPYSGPGDPPLRDPRGIYISVVHLAFAPAGLRVRAAGREVRFFPAHLLPALAFDHEEIIAQCVRHVDYLSLWPRRRAR